MTWTHTARRFAPCAAWLLWGGCSAFDLGDFELSCEAAPLRPGQTLADYEDPCAALNERAGIVLGDVCQAYQCSPDGKGCVKRALDLDGDGSPNAGACGTAGDGGGRKGLALDCDDSDPRRAPAYDEHCDGLDNDCDGLVDEELPWRGVPFLVSEPQDTGALSDVSGVPLESGRLLLTTTRGRPGFDFMTEGLIIDSGGIREALPLTPESNSGDGTAELRLDRVRSAVVGSQVLWVGRNLLGCAEEGELALGTSSTESRSDLQRRRWRTFPNRADGCGAPATDTIGAPSLAGRRGSDGTLTGLVTWRAPESGDVYALHVRTVDRPGSADPAQLEPAGLAHRLGKGIGEPSVAAWVGEVDGDGYLVAYVGKDSDCPGGIRLHRVGVDPGLEAALLGTRKTCLRRGRGAAHVRVAVDRDAVDATGQKDVGARGGLALAWREADRVLFAPLKLLKSGVRLRDHQPVALSARAKVEAGPELVHLPRGFRSPDMGEPDGWVIVWQQDEQLVARRVAREDGRPTDQAFVLTDPLETGAQAQIFVTTSAALPVSEEPPLAIFAMGRGSQSSRLTVGAVRCGPR